MKETGKTFSVKCERCRNTTKLTGYNFFRVVYPCPECGFLNSFSSALGRAHGYEVGEYARKMIERLTHLTIVPNPAHILRECERRLQLVINDYGRK